jgi:hypothetical protein
MFIRACQQRVTVGGASCACVSQRDSIGLHNVGGRMGEFRLLYLLCMLLVPVPLHSVQYGPLADGDPASKLPGTSPGIV